MYCLETINKMNEMASSNREGSFSTTIIGVILLAIVAGLVGIGGWSLAAVSSSQVANDTPAVTPTSPISTAYDDDSGLYLVTVKQGNKTHTVLFSKTYKCMVKLDEVETKPEKE